MAFHLAQLVDNKFVINVEKNYRSDIDYNFRVLS